LSYAAKMAQRFLEQAEADLAAAEYTMDSPYPFTAVRDAFEAAEKALKAGHYHTRAEEAPYTHDLGELLARVVERVGAAPETVVSSVGLLDPRPGRVRSPSKVSPRAIPANTITTGDARRAVQACRHVVTWVRELLGKPPGRPKRTTSF
jgi:HEPN domain-containing protein